MSSIRESKKLIFQYSIQNSQAHLSMHKNLQMLVHFTSSKNKYGNLDAHSIEILKSWISTIQTTPKK